MIRRSRGEVIIVTVDAELMATSLTLPFMTEAAYARRSGATRQVLLGAETVEAAAPPMFPASDFYDLSPLRYDFPAVTLTTLRDVLVRGRSNILTTADAIVRHGLYDPRPDILPEDFYDRLKPSEDQAEATWAAADPFNVGYLPEAAVFTDASSFNYAHWMTEVLPRLVAFVRHGGRGGVQLIVDDELHPNLMASIPLAVGSEVTLHLLRPDASVRVGVLHNVSPSGYVPFSLRPQSEVPFSHGVFSPSALGEMIGRLRDSVASPPPGEPRPKLFVRRRTKVRRLDNEEEIEAALVARGFVAVAPERLSLPEQVAMFSNAAMVVGATGAALTNVMFCRPDCPMVVLMPRFRQTGYWYWRRIAAAAAAGPVMHVSGPQIRPLDDPFHAVAMHQDFRVEVRDVLDAVEAADVLRR
jgi:capsular polysaccharide biosynthesis protein